MPPALTTYHGQDLAWSSSFRICTNTCLQGCQGGCQCGRVPCPHYITCITYLYCIILLPCELAIFFPSYFIKEGAEAQRGEGICPRPSSKREAEPDSLWAWLYLTISPHTSPQSMQLELGVSPREAVGEGCGWSQDTPLSLVPEDSHSVGGSFLSCSFLHSYPHTPASQRPPGLTTGFQYKGATKFSLNDKVTVSQLTWPGQATCTGKERWPP